MSGLGFPGSQVPVGKEPASPGASRVPARNDRALLEDRIAKMTVADAQDVSDRIAAIDDPTTRIRLSSLWVRSALEIWAVNRPVDAPPPPMPGR